MLSITFLKIEKNTLTQTPTLAIPDKPHHEDIENIRVVYAGLVSKRTTYDLMLWQAPMISLTAQAFLLQIALGDSAIESHRIISGFAATFIGLASWHLFIRHAAMERQASEALEKLEKRYFSEKAHYSPEEVNGPFADTPAKPVWRVCLLLVSLIGLLPTFEEFFPFRW